MERGARSAKGRREGTRKGKGGREKGRKDGTWNPEGGRKEERGNNAMNRETGEPVIEKPCVPKEKNRNCRSNCRALYRKQKFAFIFGHFLIFLASFEASGVWFQVSGFRFQVSYEFSDFAFPGMKLAFSPSPRRRPGSSFFSLDSGPGSGSGMTFFSRNDGGGDPKFLFRSNWTSAARGGADTRHLTPNECPILKSNSSF